MQKIQFHSDTRWPGNTGTSARDQAGPEDAAMKKATNSLRPSWYSLREKKWSGRQEKNGKAYTKDSHNLLSRILQRRI